MNNNELIERTWKAVDYVNKTHGDGDDSRHPWAQSTAGLATVARLMHERQKEDDKHARVCLGKFLDRLVKLEAEDIECTDTHRIHHANAAAIESELAKIKERLDTLFGWCNSDRGILADLDRVVRDTGGILERLAIIQDIVTPEPDPPPPPATLQAAVDEIRAWREYREAEASAPIYGTITHWYCRCPELYEYPYQVDQCLTCGALRPVKWAT